jgi:hypothetical protein
MPERALVQLFIKPECHLCEIARGWLDDFAADPDRYRPFDLTEIDIRQDPDIFAQYRYRIPVIMIDGQIVAEGRMDADAEFSLARALQMQEPTTKRPGSTTR